VNGLSIHRSRRILRRTRGFSLVELMVALVLTGFVVLAVVTTYGSTRETYVNQDEVARLQENVRIGTGILERTLRQGNYKRIPAARDQNPLLLTAFSYSPLLGIDGSSTTVGDSDTVQVVFNGGSKFPPDPVDPADGTIVDCLGTAVAADQNRASRFAVRVVAGRPWLSCQRTGFDDTWVDLIPDVEAMEVEYGTYADETRTVAVFTPWASTIDPARVVALRLSLLFRSAAQVAPAPATTTYRLAERTYGPFDDRFIRTQVEATVVVRSTAM
jgi:type IV pilus assembly protein PilW